MMTSIKGRGLVGGGRGGERRMGGEGGDGGGEVGTGLGIQRRGIEMMDYIRDGFDSAVPDVVRVCQLAV